MRPVVSLAGGCVPLAAALLAGCVSPVPLTLSESFSDPATRPVDAPHPPRRAPNAPPCVAIVDRLADVRTDPGLLGNVAGRPVRAPENVDSWLTNVMSGLGSRGIAVSFDSNPAHAADPLMTSVTLKLAWVSDLHTSKNATTLLHVRVKRGDNVVTERDYRGADTAINWSSGDGELQRMVDRSFGRALDQIAVDLRAACDSR